MKKDRTYRAYLLRLWSVTRDGKQTWFFSLEDSRTGERYGFSDLKGLFDFLLGQITRSMVDTADSDPAQRSDK
jgi:hypothetical protein